MNFHKYVKMETKDIKEIAPQILLNFNENFNKTMLDIKKVIDYLVRINPSVKIYMFGVYPMFESQIVRLSLTPFYMSVNEKIKNYFSSYENIHFVDVIKNIFYVAKDDCHPNFNGQKYMKKNILTSLKYN